MAQENIFSKIFSYRRWRFLTKLLVPTLTIVIVFSIAFIVIATFISTNAIDNLSSQQLITNATAGSDIIGQAIKSKINEIELHSSKNVFVNALNEARKWDFQRKYQEYENSLNLETYRARFPNPTLYENNFNFYNSREYLEIMRDKFGFEEVMVTDLNGMTIIANYKTSNPDNKEETWFINCKNSYFNEGKLVSVEPPQFDDPEHGFAIILSAPIIRLGEKQPAGFIVTKYPCSSAYETIDSINQRFKDSGYSISIRWIGNDGFVLEHSDKASIGNNVGDTPSLGQKNVKEKGLKLENGKYYDKDGKLQTVITSTSWKIHKKVSSKYVEIRKLEKELEKKEPPKTDAEINDLKSKLITLNLELAKLQTDYGFSSNGSPGFFGVAEIGKTQGVEDNFFGYTYTKFEPEEYTRPIRNLQLAIIPITLIILILLVTFLTFLARAIVFPILTLRGALLEVSYGNYDITVPVKSEDEIGEVSKTFNQLLKDIRGYISTDEDRQRQDRQVTSMLGVVSNMSSGDLTKEAEVTADVMGAVADSINYMAQQLKGIINQVSDVSTNIGSSASEILASTEHLSKGAQQQHELITDTSAAVDEMAISINQVSQSAESAANAAQNSAQIAEIGGNTVGEAVEGMNKIRSSVAEISKRIKKLGESSQEIGEIVNVISDIAGQTNMLALNAAIEAARAGEQGRGFAVVADAVRQLAERSSKATKDIALLIKGIQAETQEAVKVMEDSTTEVVEGSKLAENAKQKLDEIIGNSRQLAELISSISLSSRQQSRATEEVNKAMTSISEITTQTTTGVVQAAESVGEMARLAEMLQEQIKRFKI